MKPIKKIGVIASIALLLMAFATPNPPKWDGIMLLSKSDGAYYLFIDKTQDISTTEVIIRTTEGLKTFNLNETGRLIVFEDKGPEGWIQVKKNGVAQASVSLGKFLMTPMWYINARVKKMGTFDYANNNIYNDENDETDDNIIAKTPSADMLTEALEEEDAQREGIELQDITERDELTNASHVNAQGLVNDNLDVEGIDEDVETTESVPQTHSSFEIAKDAQSFLEKLEAHKTSLVKTDMTSFSRIQDFLIKYDPLSYNLSYETAEEAQQKALKVPEELNDLASFIDEDYVLVNDFQDWKIIRNKKSDKTYAFTGDHLFRFDINEFEMMTSSDADMIAFFEKNNLSLYPVNRRWIGLYAGDQYIGGFKRMTNYSVNITEDQKLSIRGKHNTTLLEFTDNQRCIMSFDDDDEPITIPLSEEAKSIMEEEAYMDKVEE